MKTPAATVSKMNHLEITLSKGVGNLTVKTLRYRIKNLKKTLKDGEAAHG